MKILTEPDFSVTRWSGGTTTQLAIFPGSATLAGRDFDWRISSAVVEEASSDFTVFEGYERILIPLKGKIEMEHQTPNGVIQQNVGEFELARFSGSWPTKGKGKVIDFNLVFKPDLHPKVHVTHFSEETSAGMEETADIVFLQSGSLMLNNQRVQSPALLVNDRQEQFEMECSNGSVIITVALNSMA